MPARMSTSGPGLSDRRVSSMGSGAHLTAPERGTLGHGGAARLEMPASCHHCARWVHRGSLICDDPIGSAFGALCTNFREYWSKDSVSRAQFGEGEQQYGVF